MNRDLAILSQDVAKAFLLLYGVLELHSKLHGSECTTEIDRQRKHVANKCLKAKVSILKLFVLSKLRILTQISKLPLALDDIMGEIRGIT